MALKLVGIVDFNDNVHCLEHAPTVASYREEIYSIDPARECWCGKSVGTHVESATPEHTEHDTCYCETCTDRYVYRYG